MSRGPIYLDSYKPQFSGHETFPLRYGWLKKAHNAIEKHDDPANSKAVFTRDESIAYFGVGKNMVSSIRHWATACGVIEEGKTSGSLAITSLGKHLFGDHGLDPYMEHPASLWLFHWNLAGKEGKTTWFWAFNHFSATTFGRENLVSALEALCKDRAWPRVSLATIRRDVDCFLRTYVARRPSGKASLEQTLESPLVELGLIKGIGNRDGFRFVRGPKSTLGLGVFLYALIGFWQSYNTTANTLSFETIAHEPGSPGRVFLLDEGDITERLLHLEELTDGNFRLSETAGLKQVQCSSILNIDSAFEYVRHDYPQNRQHEAT